MHLWLRKCEKSPQTCRFAVAEHLLQFCRICGCGIECKFAVPSSDCWFDSYQEPNFLSNATFPPIVAKPGSAIIDAISTCIILSGKRMELLQPQFGSNIISNKFNSFAPAIID